MGLQGPVLVAADLSDDTDTTLRQAHAVAAEIDAPLIVAHVLPETFRVRMLFPQDAGVDPMLQADLERRAGEAIRARMVSALGSEAAAAAIEFESGTPHSGILAMAQRVGAGLIVVGPGATAHRVARSAGCPVLVARASPTGGGVVGATDFSDPALPAVRMAADEASRRGVALRLVHCLDVDETAYLATAGLAGFVTMPPSQESVFDDLEAAARGRLDEALAAAGASGDARVLRRPAAAGIIEAAESPAAALIVVGTRGRTGLPRLALGSVAEDVMSQAPCAVLVVPLHPE